MAATIIFAPRLPRFSDYISTCLFELFAVTPELARCHPAPAAAAARDTGLYSTSSFGVCLQTGLIFNERRQVRYCLQEVLSFYERGTYWGNANASV